MMLSRDEVGEVVNALGERANKYIEQIDDPFQRFYAICADVGIDESIVKDMIEWIAEAHYGVTAKIIFMLDEKMAISMAHSVLAGIEIGKKMSKVIAIEGMSELDPDELDRRGDDDG